MSGATLMARRTRPRGFAPWNRRSDTLAFVQDADMPQMGGRHD